MLKRYFFCRPLTGPLGGGLGIVKTLCRKIFQDSDGRCWHFLIFVVSDNAEVTMPMMQTGQVRGAIWPISGYDMAYIVVRYDTF